MKRIDAFGVKMLRLLRFGEPFAMSGTRVASLNSCARFGYCFTAILLLVFGSCSKHKLSEEQTMKVYSANTDLVGFSVIQLTNGTYVAALHEDTSSGASLLFAVDADGNKLWSVIVNEQPVINSIAATPDGGFVTGGATISKYSGDGQKVWSSTAWFDSVKTNLTGLSVSGYPIVCTDAGSDIFMEYRLYRYDTAGNVEDQYYLSQMSEDGTLQGINPLSLPGHDSVVYDMFKMVATESGIYVTGYQFFTKLPSFSSPFPAENYCVFNISSGGDISWIICPGNPNNNYPQLALNNQTSSTDIITGPGNTMISAIDTSTLNGVTFYYDAGHGVSSGAGEPMFEIIDCKTGAVNKQYLMSFPDVNMHPHIAHTTDGGYVITFTADVKPGYVNSNNNFTSGAGIGLVKTDANLNPQWAKTIDCVYLNRPFGVFQTPDGGYLIFSYIVSLGINKSDLLVTKVNSTGNIVGN